MDTLSSFPFIVKIEYKNWHTIGTTLARFCSFPVKASMLYLVQSKICKAAVFHSGRRLFSSERRWFYYCWKQFPAQCPKQPAGHPPHKGRPGRNPAAILKSENGDVNYFSTVVFIFIAVILLAFILDLFSIISTKQELDHCADQMVKQIQLSGGVNGETEQLFNFLCSQIEGAENISYSIDASYKSPTPSGMSRAIQLGTPFYITITGRAKLGGFWNFNLVNITVVSRGAGVSEHYWK